MTPFYFGDVDKPLFGAHHQPHSEQYQDTSIVICNPIGFEYGRAHSFIRQLAIKFSQQGYHVLRFDYYATGDSSGGSDEISLQQCQENIVLACDEIKTISATRKVTVIGFRFGAMLASLVAQDYKFNRLVLWDAIVDGDVYLQDLINMHNDMLRDPNRFDLRFASDAENTNDLIGHYFLPQFREEISQCKLLNIKKIKTKKIDVMCYPKSYCREDMPRGDSFLLKANMYSVDRYLEWANADKIESKVLPDMSIQKIIECVA